MDDWKVRDCECPDTAASDDSAGGASIRPDNTRRTVSCSASSRDTTARCPATCRAETFERSGACRGRIHAAEGKTSRLQELELQRWPRRQFGQRHDAHVR